MSDWEVWTAVHGEERIAALVYAQTDSSSSIGVVICC